MSGITNLRDELTRSTLVLCRDTFAEYARLHRAKGTPESDVKALRNEDMVDLISKVLGEPDHAA